MKPKTQKQHLIAILAVTVTALLVCLCIPHFMTPDIPQPAGIYYQPTCEDGTGGWYTLLLPESWEDLVEIEAIPDPNGAYTTNVYSVKDREEGGGLLFSFRFYPEGSDFSMLPSTELGIVETADGNRYHFLFSPPSDMQFAIENAENYIAMQEEGTEIAQTIEFKEDVRFTPAAE